MVVGLNPRSFYTEASFHHGKIIELKGLQRQPKRLMTPEGHLRYGGFHK